MADWLETLGDPTQQDMIKAQVQALRARNNPQDIAQQARAAALLGAFHDPGMQNMGKMLGGEATAREAETQPRLSAAMQAIQQGPQAALGGQTPQNFKLLMEQAAIPRVASDMFGRYFMRGPKAGQNIPGVGGMDQMLSPEAIDQSAEVYFKTGQLPQFGRANPLVHGAIIKRAAELHPNTDLTTSRASVKADTASLENQQKILDNAEGWERTGHLNLQVLLGISKQLKDTGSPWLNSPVRTFMEKGIGDPNQTAFKAAHATVVNEYAKILSGAQGSTAITDSARKEAEGMLPLNATWDQLEAAAKVLDTDAGNRISSARQQVGNIKGRIGGAGATVPQPMPAAPTPVAPQQAAPAAGPRPRRTANGETREWDGTKWVPIGR